MALTRQLLLAAAAALTATAAGAGNGTAPRAAAPADIDGPCGIYGAAFVHIVGTQTCVRLSGEVAADLQFHSLSGPRYTQPAAPGAAPPSIVRSAPAGEGSGFAAGARVGLDAITETGIGPVRTVIEIGPRILGDGPRTGPPP